MSSPLCELNMGGAYSDTTVSIEVFIDYKLENYIITIALLLSAFVIVRLLFLSIFFSSFMLC